MTDTPLFTVIIPTYNRLKLCKETVRSVLKQTFSDYEVLVIDDGSTDGTKEHFESINIEKVTYIYKENAGVSTARNTGVALSSGRYICYLDSDDLWHEDKLEKIARTIKVAPDADVVFHDFVKHDLKLEKPYETSNSQIFPVIYEVFTQQKEGSLWVSKSDKALQVIVRGYPFYPSAFVIKKAVHEQYLWDPGVLKSEDFNFILKLALRYRFYYLDEVLAIIQVHENNKSADMATKDTVIVNTLNAFRRLYLKGPTADYVAERTALKSFSAGKHHLKNGSIGTGLTLISFGLLDYRFYRNKLRRFKKNKAASDK